MLLVVVVLRGCDPRRSLSGVTLHLYSCLCSGYDGSNCKALFTREGRFDRLHDIVKGRRTLRREYTRGGNPEGRGRDSARTGGGRGEDEAAADDDVVAAAVVLDVVGSLWPTDRLTPSRVRVVEGGEGPHVDDRDARDTNTQQQWVWKAEEEKGPRAEPAPTTPPPPRRPAAAAAADDDDPIRVAVVSSILTCTHARATGISDVRTSFGDEEETYEVAIDVTESASFYAPPLCVAVTMLLLLLLLLCACVCVCACACVLSSSHRSSFVVFSSLSVCFSLLVLVLLTFPMVVSHSLRALTS